MMMVCPLSNVTRDSAVRVNAPADNSTLAHNAGEGTARSARNMVIAISNLIGTKLQQQSANLKRWIFSIKCNGLPCWQPCWQHGWWHLPKKIAGISGSGYSSEVMLYGFCGACILARPH